jgi:UDP-N-acetylmuramoylalanine-D-glutamate ligase
MNPRATSFNFLTYTFSPKSLEIKFSYEITFSNRAPLSFTETITLPEASQKIGGEALARFFEPLHLILGISYYKLYCPKKITLPYALSKEQAEFWNTVYRKGLGEFSYRNHIDPKQIAKFPFKKTGATPVRVSTSNGILLGIGGGKDSIVAAELLRDFPVTTFLVETERRDLISENVMRVLGYPSLSINRKLDPKIFEHHPGSYNGHIPISAIFAFLGILSSALYGYNYFAVANEHSSNFGNITWKGEIINHQWSKSAEFETLFQEYTRAFITPDITYTSVLRQFYEIRVAKLFAQQEKYFPIFSSCNRNFRVHTDRPAMLWCGECPKCAYVFLLLAPYLSKEKLTDIFGKNLLNEKSLIPLFADILGFGSMKPFDCVGTFEESQAALYLASKNWKNTIVVKTFLSKIKKPEARIAKVFKTTPAPTLPTPFKFLGIDNVAIIGYGREGKVTETYLKKKYPKLKIGILDEATDKNYLKKQGDYDLAIKTPGIPKRFITIPYTTATNIFFSENKNLTIGITGSKGKSTTTSLVYEMLKADGKKVRLLGNIGNPMLGVLLDTVDPKEIFVIELSSYMLEDIEYSPNVALLLNLFPEHMNYHGSLEAYYLAKKNIFKFQKLDDAAFVPPFKAKIPVSKKEIPLLGSHNESNIKAAMAIAKHFNVSNAAIAQAIKHFKPLPHRLEKVGTFSGITFYDDAISTTPESTIEALKTLKKVDTIFLGGTDRGYDFKELEKALRKFNVKNIVLFPDSGKRILKSEKGFTILKTKSMKAAAQFAYKHTKKGSICLLSTASPSYSLWKNFEEKGALFTKEVQKISAEK